MYYGLLEIEVVSLILYVFQFHVLHQLQKDVFLLLSFFFSFFVLVETIFS
uniref:Uncharacterized protein n=1 Tax=Rhizophora mucronata TaxID=61149 RepID=A0A2P2NQT1_RHIMU